MIKEILKKSGLEDNQVEAILNSMKEAKIYTSNLENIDVRYGKLKDKVSQLEETNKNYEVQIKDLSKNNKDNSELQAQIEQLQLSNKELIEKHTKEMYEKDFNSALDKTLSSAKCKNIKSVRALLDMDSIKYQEGKLEGLEEQIEVLRKSDSYLFEETSPTNTGGLGNFGRSNNNPTGGDSTSTFIDTIRNNSLRK